MLQEFKTFLRIQNLLLENLNLTLIESTEIASFIIDIIKKYNEEKKGTFYKKDKVPFKELEINTDLSNIQKVDTGEEEDTLTIRTNGKNQQIKIGRLLRQLLPNARGEDIEALFYKIKEKVMEKFNILNNYEFIIENDVVKWYEYCEKKNVGSCMTKPEIIETDILKLYKLDNNIKILLIKNKTELTAINNDILEPGIIIARALVWYNTSLEKPFIDRLYVYNKLNYMDIYNAMTLWAEKNGYAYKGPGREDNSINNSSSNVIKYQISDEIWKELKYLPYMDTLCYLDINKKLLSNEENSGNIRIQNINGTLISNIKFYCTIQDLLNDKISNLKDFIYFKIQPIDNDILFYKTNIAEVLKEYETKDVLSLFKIYDTDEFLYEINKKVFFTDENRLIFKLINNPIFSKKIKIALMYLKIDDFHYNVANCFIYENTSIKKSVFGNIYEYAFFLTKENNYDFINKITKIFSNFLESKNFINYKNIQENISIHFDIDEIHEFSSYIKENIDVDDINYEIDIFNSINYFGELSKEELKNGKTIRDYIDDCREGNKMDFLTLLITRDDKYYFHWFEWIEDKNDYNLKKLIKFLDKEYNNLVKKYKIDEHFKYINNSENIIVDKLKNEKWNNGILINAIWEDGIWKHGLWVDGIWKDGIWNNGKWLDGIWKDGAWKGGIWENGTWENGTFEEGEWFNGIWKNGIWKNGNWYDGVWGNGEWKKGGIYSKKFNFIKLCEPKINVKNFNPNLFYKLEKESKTKEELLSKLKEYIY